MTSTPPGSNSGKLKLAYILTPITFGGAEKVAINFLRTVDRKRFDVRPILLVRPWEEETFLGREIRKAGYSYESVPVAVSDGNDFFRVLRVYQKISRLLKEGGFDVVHTNGYFADICGLPAARLLGMKTVATCHGYINSSVRLKAYNLLDKLALRACHRIFAVSQEIKNELTSAGIKTSRVSVLPNAVHISDDTSSVNPAIREERRRGFSLQPDEFVAGFVGRLSEEKGVRFLIQAAAVLKEHSIWCRILIVGEGPDRTALEELAVALEVQDMVTFTGFVANVEEWIASLDVFVLPSLSEGTPVALLEAMSAGVPVIASAVGGVPRIVQDQFNGFLVQPGDVPAISARIHTLMLDVGMRRSFAERGLQILKSNFSLSRWCRTVEESYLQI